jgi:hypothetical protein
MITLPRSAGSGPDQVLDHFGRAILLAADYPCDLAVFAMLLDRLGVTRRYRTDAADPGWWSPG